MACDEQVDQFPVCQRCRNEGLRRKAKVDEAKEKHKRVALRPMKYSKKNTGLEFRWADSDPLATLERVDETLIALVNALVTIQKVVGM